MVSDFGTRLREAILSVQAEYTNYAKIKSDKRKLHETLDDNSEKLLWLKKYVSESPN